MFEEVIEELRAKLLIDSQNWASERRAEPPLSNPAPLVWRAPEGLEGLAAVPVGGGRAWPDNTQTPRPIEGRREACGAWPDNEATRRTANQRPGPTGVEGAGGTGGPGCGARGRRGLAGQRADVPSHTPAHQTPQV